MTHPILEARGVTKRFGGVTALRDVSLAVGAGELCGLIGPNGAGKTTLFDVFSGVQTPTAGSVLLDSTDVTRRSASWRSRHGIKRTFQRQQCFGWLSVADNLLVALEWRGGGGGIAGDLFRLPGRRRLESARRSQVEEALELMELGAIRDLPASSLSIGQARLVEMARAVVDRPKALLLDEPTSGLPSEDLELLATAVEGIRRETGCAVILVEHDVRFVLDVCTRIVVLHLGSVLATGTPSEIRDDERVADAYLGSKASASS